MDPAIIGLAGVLVGAGITAGSNYLLAVRKEQAEEARERQRRSAEFLVASRLVYQELVEAGSASKVARQRGRGWERLERNVSESWKEYGSILAQYLSTDDWSTIAIAYIAVSRLPTYADESSIVDDRLENLSNIISSIDQASSILSPYARDMIRLKVDRMGTVRWSKLSSPWWAR